MAICLLHFLFQQANFRLDLNLPFLCLPRTRYHSCSGHFSDLIFAIAGEVLYLCKDVACSVLTVHFFVILLSSGHLDVIFSLLLCICSQLTREVFLWYLRAIFDCFCSDPIESPFLSCQMSLIGGEPCAQSMVEAFFRALMVLFSIYIFGN